MFQEKSPLRLLNQFDGVLKRYRPSLELLDLLSDTKFILLSAPTAAGRNTLIKNLILTGKYFYVVSDTTRTPRINNGVPERSGNEYWFKSEEEVLTGLKNGAYVECAIIHNQQVSGISLDEMRRADNSGKIAITDVTIQGCDSIKSYSDSTVAIFVLPPTFKEWMNRLDGRGAMDPAEKHRRLISATEEIQTALERSYFKFIINWDLRTTVEQLHEQIMSEQFGVAEQNAMKSHAKELLGELNAYLSK